MEEGSLYWEWSHSLLVVLDFIRRKVEQNHGEQASKQQSHWSLYQLLNSGSYHVWVHSKFPAMMEYRYGHISKINPFHPNILLCFFIISIVTQTTQLVKMLSIHRRKVSVLWKTLLSNQWYIFSLFMVYLIYKRNSNYLKITKSSHSSQLNPFSEVHSFNNNFIIKVTGSSETIMRIDGLNIAHSI